MSASPAGPDEALAGPRAAASLAARLRQETAALHTEVELVADLPGSIAGRADYRRLLRSFEQAYLELTAGPRTGLPTEHWVTLGVEPAGAGQLGLIRADLAVLGSSPTLPYGQPVPTSADEQLGHLYVLEGSALGRRVLAPLLMARLGPIPVSFFLDETRHPRGWLALQSALRALDGDVDRHPGVLRGARHAFQVFLRHLHAPTRADRPDLALP